MKTLKKALSVILGLAIMLSCVMGMQVSVAAEGTLTVEVGEATVGDGVVTVPVIATGSLQAFTVTVDYDNNVLALADAEKVALPGVEDQAVFGPTDAEIFKMMWAFALVEADVVLDNTQIATLTFNVEDDSVGTYIDIEVTEAWDVNGNAVTATAIDGDVDFVKEPECEHVDITPRKPAIRVQEKYGFRVRVDHTDIASVEHSYYKVVLETQIYEGGNYTLKNITKTFLSTERDVSSTSTRDYYFYNDITAYAMNIPVYITLEFYNAKDQKVAYSNTTTFILSDKAKEELAADDTYTPPKLKTMYMDMLNYATEAQVYFSQFGTDNPLKNAEPINSNCEDFLGFASAEIPTFAGVSIPDDCGTGFACTPGLQVSSSNNVYYRFTVPTNMNAEELTVSFVHNDLYGKTITSETKNFADFEIDKRGRYVFPYNGVALYDSSAVVTATVKDAQGSTVFTLDYNIDMYVSANIDTDDLGALFKVLSKFSNSSKIYFESLIK